MLKGINILTTAVPMRVFKSLLREMFEAVIRLSFVDWRSSLLDLLTITESSRIHITPQG